MFLAIWYKQSISKYTYNKCSCFLFALIPLVFVRTLWGLGLGLGLILGLVLGLVLELALASIKKQVLVFLTNGYIKYYTSSPEA